MGWVIVLFIGTFLMNCVQRMFLRSEIKKKHWIKHKSGKFFRDWFLWDFKEVNGRKPWVIMLFVLTITNGVVFLLGIIGYIFEIEALIILQMLVLIVSTLSMLWETTRIKYLPPHDTPYYKISNRLFLILFTVLCLFLCVALSVGVVIHIFA